jgi:hypothetical protein
MELGRKGNSERFFYSASNKSQGKQSPVCFLSNIRVVISSYPSGKNKKILRNEFWGS